MSTDMVVSGIPCRTPFHAREVANMALDLVDECTVFEIPHLPDQPLKIRVGLHSGLSLYKKRMNIFAYDYTSYLCTPLIYIKLFCL